MPSQVDEIRERVAAVAERKVRPLLVTPVKVPKGSGLGLIAFLGACILLLSAATFFVLRNRAQVVEAKTIIPATTQPAKTEWNTLIARMDKADRRMDVLAHRSWLLSMALNENAAIQQANDLKRFGVKDSGYIVFDENWKLNRVPQSMTLDEKQQKDILK